MSLPEKRVSNRLFTTCGFVLALLSACKAAPAAPEKWADERLAVRDGLVLWLDASRQVQAFEQEHKPAPQDAKPAGVWFDGSGNKLHLAQPAAAAQPMFERPDAGRGVASFRFDGVDDCLTLAASREPLNTATLILVAAPHTSAGDFRALFSAAAVGKNDYQTGLNIDLGPFGSPRFDTLNLEGAGAQDFVNLFTNHPAQSGFDLDTFHVIALPVAADPGRVRLLIDGKAAGQRHRTVSKMSLDRLAVGARLYSNEPNKAPYLRGFFDGRIAEVLLYDHVLGKDDLARVQAYLDEKYPLIRETPATSQPAGARPLVAVKDPPAVQVFVPGFSVRKLPLDLTNINNLRYRPDGKLVAVAYDGNVYVLSDTDGDSLEDHAELFWDNKGRVQSPIGTALTPPNYPHGNGLFVAAKGKVSLIVDTDKDDKADKEIVIAGGWTPLPINVDALGVALEPDGSVLFGLATANYANAYLIGPDGKAGYDLKNERGTIQRIAPDFSKRETVVTGIRIPVSLAFNAQGDLFSTDQEGATWLPNGNPFDELLHIRPGRHYGFPPRHPKHLPGVIDEPSVFDYRPQHQSTCGLAFNEPVNGGPVFGPKAWRGDALVTGYSRGKLFRTQLVKTPAGYVVQNHLLAGSTMLLADVCVSPAGDAVLAAHGGAPDWGTGPAGKGALYKITYTDRPAPRPQPLFAYPAGAREVRVAFDRPLDFASLKGLAEKATIEFGDAVSAADRFEVLRPGYEVVKRQLLAPRFGLDVLGVSVTPDRRTLVVQTAPMSRAVGYAITLPGLNPSNSPVAQVDAVDLAFDLGGVLATWTPGDGKGTPEWTGWLPHLDFAASNALTTGSAEHDVLREKMKRKGVLRLQARLDLSNMLRPAVQPGSKLDYEPTPEDVTLVFAGGGVSVQSPDSAAIELVADATRVKVLAPKQWLSLTLSINTRDGDAPPVALAVSYYTNEDPRPRALALRRMLVPSARPESSVPPDAADAEPAPPPELAGGNWARGRAAFHSEQAMCAKCHRLREDGTGKIGPDLSNLHHRDYASVLQDVTLPSAAINPDHVAYAITLTSGDVLAGVPRSDGETAVIVGEPGGKETRLERAAIKSMEPLATSIMPHGIDQTIGKAALRDLMTFILAPPLEPAKPEIPGAPTPRTRAEVDAVLKAGREAQRGAGVSPASSNKNPNAGETPAPQKSPKSATRSTPRPLHILLAAGPKDHGPGEHDYPLWQKRWAQLLGRAEGVEIDTAFGWPEPKQFDTADVVVFFSSNPNWTADKAAQLDTYLKRGGGLVYLHFAVNGRDAPDALADRIGLASRGGGVTQYRHGPLDLSFPDSNHPITRGFERVHFVDESYWKMIGDVGRIHALANSTEDNAPQPQLWTFEPAGTTGRVFVNILGHYNWTFDDPLFRVLVLRGIAWCAHEVDTERLAPLATMGARLATE